MKNYDYLKKKLFLSDKIEDLYQNIGTPLLYNCFFLPFTSNQSSDVIDSVTTKVQIFSDHETDRFTQLLLSWKMGALEIHHIISIKGETTFLFIQGGTTMLIDAGDESGRSAAAVDPWPELSESVQFADADLLYAA
jgi:hypothetical protein